MIRASVCVILGPLLLKAVAPVVEAEAARSRIIADQPEVLEVLRELGAGPVLHNNMAPLAVISKAYVEPCETAFQLQEKVFSLADSFDIKDAEGRPAFKLQGKHFSFHDKKTLYDRNDEPVAILSKKTLSLHGTWHIYAADGETLLASIRDKVLAVKAHADVIIHEFGTEPYLNVRGDFRGKNFQVVHGEDTVATVQRKGLFHDATKFFTGEDHYSLTVAPHVDTAFAVALTIIFDAMFNDDSD